VSENASLSKPCDLVLFDLTLPAEPGCFRIPFTLDEVSVNKKNHKKISISTRLINLLK
jgi:hypothetical protein